jgi:hypothetical protein
LSKNKIFARTQDDGTEHIIEQTHRRFVHPARNSRRGIIHAFFLIINYSYSDRFDFA